MTARSPEQDRPRRQRGKTVSHPTVDRTSDAGSSSGDRQVRHCVASSDRFPADPERTGPATPLLPRQPVPPPVPAWGPSSDIALPPRATDSAEVPDGALPRLLSTADVTAVFDRSDRTIRNWIRQGHLQPVRVGGAVFFRENDIRALLSGHLCRRALS